MTVKSSLPQPNPSLARAKHVLQRFYELSHQEGLRPTLAKALRKLSFWLDSPSLPPVPPPEMPPVATPAPAVVEENLQTVRQDIAFRYIKGDGIEVGALHAPVEVSAQARVRYVDRMPVAELRQQYPELAELNLVTVDIVDDGEKLTTIADNSLDFAIANHMIEHCQNPIATLKSYLRVLKPGGIIYLAVPDKRYTFDCDRPNTTLDHLLRDYTEGTEWSRRGHFEEYVRLVDKVPESDVEAKVKRYMDMDYSIHFHVWEPSNFFEWLNHCQTTLKFPFEVELFRKNAIEFIFVLRKTA